MTPDTWTAALFDLDGTLIDSEVAHRAAFRSFFASRAWDVPADVYRHFTGRRADDVFAELPGPWSGEDPYALMAEVVTHIDRDAHPPLPLPGGIELVEALHRRGVPIALVTSAPRMWAEDAVGRILGIGHYFTALVTREDTAAGKPDPAPYAAGALALGAAPQTTVAFEDTVAGIRSALDAGIGHVIGVDRQGEPTVLLDGGAHRVVTSLADLQPFARARLP